MRVNDGPELRAVDFGPTGAHVRGSVGVEVTKWLRAGANEVVEVDRTGKVLWKFKVGSGVVGNPITYRGPDGKQYVAVYAGIGGDWGCSATSAPMTRPTCVPGELHARHRQTHSQGGIIGCSAVSARLSVGALLIARPRRGAGRRPAAGAARGALRSARRGGRQPPPADSLRNPLAEIPRRQDAAPALLRLQLRQLPRRRRGGNIGPSLSDGRWRYSGSDGAIFHSIFYGRPRGMPVSAATWAESIWPVAYLRRWSRRWTPCPPPPVGDGLGRPRPDRAQLGLRPPGDYRALILTYPSGSAPGPGLRHSTTPPSSSR
jgi:hypothetical protein